MTRSRRSCWRTSVVDFVGYLAEGIEHPTVRWKRALFRGSTVAAGSAEGGEMMWSRWSQGLRCPAASARATSGTGSFKVAAAAQQVGDRVVGVRDRDGADDCV